MEWLDHSHIFWDCPKILLFWMGIKSEINTILGINILFNLSVAPGIVLIITSV